MPAGQLTVADLFSELTGVPAETILRARLGGRALAQTAYAETVQGPSKPLISSCAAIGVNSTVPLEALIRLLR